jgi:hypothetical protein
MNFMRLSSMKAAHVVVAWCRVQEIRVSRSVFREMWDSTAPFLSLSIHPMHLAANIGGIPYLAKNERDMGDLGWQESVSRQNPLGTGRVPHVRLSVRGPNKTGEAHHSFLRNQTAKSNRNISFSAHVSGFPARGATNTRVCGFL